MAGPSDQPWGSENPFAPPQPGPTPGPDAARSSAEEIRRRHLGHEHYIQAIGLWGVISGLISILGGLFLLFVSPEDYALLMHSFGMPIRERAGGDLGLAGSIWLGWGIVHWVAGLGLQRYNRAARILMIAGCLASLGGIAYGAVARPAGRDPGAFLTMLAVALFLHVLLARKARMIFSREYREIIEQTPDIEPKSGCLLILFGILICSGLDVAARVFGIGMR